MNGDFAVDTKPTRTEDLLFFGWLGFLSILVLWAAYWGLLSFVSDHDYFGNNDKIPWGILISSYAFFVSSIGSCFVAALGSVFNFKEYEVIETRAIFLAIVIVIVGMGVMGTELGHPLRMFTAYVSTPNITSPIWWMGLNYTSYLTFTSIEWLFLLQHKHRLAKIFGVFALFVAVAAHSTVGAVFGVLHARPFWYGPYLPIDFILCAWVIGFGMVVLLTIPLTWAEHLEQEMRDKYSALLSSMAKWLAAALVINLFFIFWKILTGYHSGEGSKYLAIASLLHGPLSFQFLYIEILMGVIVPFILLMISGFKNLSLIFVATTLAILGMITGKINLIMAGQVVPLGRRDDFVTYIKYTPSLAEWSILVGAFAFILLVYTLAERYFFRPIDIKEQMRKETERKEKADYQAGHSPGGYAG